jgi:carbamoyl-phosphate synthase large subunit
MEIVFSDEDLTTAMKELAADGTLGREGGLSADRPVLVDQFLDDAVEVDVDALRDNTGEVLIGGVMEHVEEAGVHSGDSACVLPPPNLSPSTVSALEGYAASIAHELEVVGLINVQFAVQMSADGDDAVFVIEANPRASRTVPFVAKATNRPLAKIAARLMAGATLEGLEAEGLLDRNLPPSGLYAVKEAVLPFSRFPDTDALLGPEMRSTGEVMGLDVSPGLAFLKAQLGAGMELSPDHSDRGVIFLSLADRDKERGMELAQSFAEIGYQFLATTGTAAALAEQGIEVVEVLSKLRDDGVVEPAGRTAVDAIGAGEVALVINTPKGRGARADGAYIRTAASINHVPLITTVAAAKAISVGLTEWADAPLQVRSLQSVRPAATG